MEIKRKLAKLSPFFQSAAVIAISVLFVGSIVYAATTIGSNITTGGTLSVTGAATTSGNLVVGAATLENATNTLNVIGNSWLQGNATTTGRLVLGTTAPTNNYGKLFITGDAYLTNIATTSVALWVGTGGTANNINLAGGDLFVQDGLEVDGTGYFARTTSTSATSTAYLMVGIGFTLPAAWDYSEDLAVSGDAVVANKATSTVALWVGSAGTVNNLNLAGGDLYVQDGLEVDGTIYGDRATSTSATTTNYLMVGSKFTLPAAWDYYEDLAVSGDAVVANKATSTVALWVGSGGTANNLNLAGGDLFVQDGIQAGGGVWANAATTTDSLAVTGDLLAKGGTYNFTTTTGTTTVGLYIDGNTGTATTSIGLGHAGQVGCIEMIDSAGVWNRLILDGGAANVKVGRCN